MDARKVGAKLNTVTKCVFWKKHTRCGSVVAPSSFLLSFSIGRSPRRDFADHAFMLHCKFFPHPLAQRGVRRAPQGRGRSLVAFNVTLLILVLEIPFNFQFDMQCDRNANSNVSFQVNVSFEQILFPWHTWARSKGLRTIGSEWPD